MAKGFQNPRYRALIAELVAERRKLGWSQEVLAGKLGCHQQHVSRYETGERRLDVVEFIDTARALGLEPARLVSEPGTRKTR